MSLLNNLIQYNFFNNQVFNFLIELMVANHVVIKKNANINSRDNNICCNCIRISVNKLRTFITSSHLHSDKIKGVSIYCMPLRFIN